MSKKKKPRPQPICPYCTLPAVLVPDTEVYRKSYGSKVWLCRPCGAWVGVHRGSPNDMPLGRLANAALRDLKIQTHAVFDPLWIAAMKLRGWSKSRARITAYVWLAAQMGLSIKRCHIGHFDEDQCRRAIEICKLRRKVDDV